MGQKNPVFVYRLIAVGTMENFVYDRQVNKSQLSKSVVDDTNVTRLFSSRDLEELFRLEHPPPIPEQEVRESSVACVAITDAQACQVDAYAPKLDVSAKNVIEGRGLQGELLEGGGDKVIASVLRGPRKNWVVKVKRHEDAVEEDNSEELTKEEEELALQEDAEEEEGTEWNLATFLQQEADQCLDCTECDAVCEEAEARCRVSRPWQPRACRQPTIWFGVAKVSIPQDKSATACYFM